MSVLEWLLWNVNYIYSENSRTNSLHFRYFPWKSNLSFYDIQWHERSLFGDDALRQFLVTSGLYLTMMPFRQFLVTSMVFIWNEHTRNLTILLRWSLGRDWPSPSSFNRWQLAISYLQQSKIIWEKSKVDPVGSLSSLDSLWLFRHLTQTQKSLVLSLRTAKCR